VGWAYVVLRIWKDHPGTVRRVMLGKLLQLHPYLVPEWAAKVGDYVIQTPEERSQALKDDFGLDLGEEDNLLQKLDQAMILFVVHRKI